MLKVGVENARGEWSITEQMQMSTCKTNEQKKLNIPLFRKYIFLQYKNALHQTEIYLDIN